jgi:hypothetical protein
MKVNKVNKPSQTLSLERFNLLTIYQLFRARGW